MVFSALVSVAVTVFFSCLPACCVHVVFMPVKSLKPVISYCHWLLIKTHTHPETHTHPLLKAAATVVVSDVAADWWTELSERLSRCSAFGFDLFSMTCWSEQLKVFFFSSHMIFKPAEGGRSTVFTLRMSDKPHHFIHSVISHINRLRVTL